MDGDSCIDEVIILVAVIIVIIRVVVVLLVHLLQSLQGWCKCYGVIIIVVVVVIVVGVIIVEIIALVVVAILADSSSQCMDSGRCIARVVHQIHTHVDMVPCMYVCPHLPAARIWPRDSILRRPRAPRRDRARGPRCAAGPLCASAPRFHRTGRYSTRRSAAHASRLWPSLCARMK